MSSAATSTPSARAATLTGHLSPKSRSCHISPKLKSISPKKNSPIGLAPLSAATSATSAAVPPVMQLSPVNISASAASISSSPVPSPLPASPFSLPGTPNAITNSTSLPNVSMLTLNETAASTSVLSAASSSSSTILYATPVAVSPSDPSLVIRRAQVSDFSKGHCKLLSQLTQIGEITEESYARRMQQFQRLSDTYHLLVIEDLTTHTIIASATLVVEFKFVHACGAAGHIEDVVVSEGYRGKNLGHTILRALHQIAKQQGCYKVMLDCAESNMTFYKKIGYREAEKHMRIDL